MTKSLYEAPSIVEIGTLHELTLLTLSKSNTGSDVINLTNGHQVTAPGEFGGVVS